jgi:hypothetical protein
MQKRKISSDDIIEFFKIYNDYLENVLYISLTKKGLNIHSHIFFMKSFVILTDKNSDNVKIKKILELLRDLLKKNSYNQKFVSLNLRDKLSIDHISSLVTIQDSVEKFFYAIELYKKIHKKYLKQGIIEFHNFLAHLLVSFSGQNIDHNKIKAINHLYRGTIDSYKSIIKTICDENCSLKNDLTEIRRKEIQNLGIEATSSNKKYDLVDDYRKFVEQLLRIKKE